MECETCNTKQKTVYQCDKCNRLLCRACANLSASEVKVLELKGDRTLKFECPVCLKFDTHMLLKNIIDDKEKIIASKDEIILLLKQKIEDLNTKQKLNPLFSDILKNPKTNETNNISKSALHVIIKPKNKQNTDKIKSDLFKHIKPAELKICINGTRNTKNGSLLVKCSNKSDIESLKREIEKKFDTDYEIQVPKMRNPCFKIIGYTAITEDDLNYDLIESNIREQNHFIQSDDELRVTYVKHRNKNDRTYTIYGECTSALFHKFMAMKKIFINWERYPIYEHMSIQKCFKCQEFYHKSDTCPNEQKCEYCAGNHLIKDCPKTQKKCSNCVQANSKYNLKYDVNHKATDGKCPAYMYLVNILRSKIDYGTNGC